MTIQAGRRKRLSWPLRSSCLSEHTKPAKEPHKKPAKEPHTKPAKEPHTKPAYQFVVVPPHPPGALKHHIVHRRAFENTVCICFVDWAEGDQDQEDVNVWEDNWDDDNIEDDFSKQLRYDTLN